MPGIPAAPQAIAPKKMRYCQQAKAIDRLQKKPMKRSKRGVVARNA
jgi:hypothetical protein